MKNIKVRLYKRKKDFIESARVLSVTKDGVFVSYRCLGQYDVGVQATYVDKFLESYVFDILVDAGLLEVKK